MTRLARALAAVACVTTLVSGCAGASNSGGNTTCADFLAKRTDDLDATVARMLKERNAKNSSTMDVINTRIKIVNACSGADKAGVEIGSLV
jgi:acid stress chaperone HdeA